MSVDLLASAGIVSRTNPLFLDHLGPRVEPITRPDADPSAPGLARGTVGPGNFVPMHSHSDPETFLVLSGSLEGLTWVDGEPRWVTIGAFEALHVPPHARHALRNVSDETATAVIVSTSALMRFFEETGRPLRSATDTLPPPTADDLERFAKASLRRGDWLASPAENAAVGIQLPAPPGLQASAPDSVRR